MNKKLLIIAAPLALLMVVAMNKKVSNKPRGVRNNNPLNIEFSKYNDWDGQTGSDGRYAKFSDAKYGFRAAAKLIDNYWIKYNVGTVRGIIEKWAPNHENPTDSYVDYVVERTGLSPLTAVTKSNRVDVLMAMAAFENGGDYYDRQTVEAGVALA
jgi:hypothetical protein